MKYHMKYKGCYCKIMVFSPIKLEIIYYHSSKGNKFLLLPKQRVGLIPLITTTSIYVPLEFLPNYNFLIITFSVLR